MEIRSEGFSLNLGPEPQREAFFWITGIWWEISDGAPLHLLWSPGTPDISEQSRVPSSEPPAGALAPGSHLDRCLLFEVCSEQPMQAPPPPSFSWRRRFSARWRQAVLV